MRFKVELVKEVRKKELNLSVMKLCFKINKLSRGEINMTPPRINKLESGLKSNVNPFEFGYICKALGKTPDFFYED